jgi:hypothetical protein
LLESASAGEFGVKLFGPNKQQRIQVELQAARRGQAFVAKTGFPFVGMLIVIIPFLGLLAYIVAEQGGWIAFAAILMLLWFFLSLGWLVLRPGPMLRMDAHGIDSALYGPIPWSEAIGLELERDILFLGIREPRRYLKNAPLWLRLAQVRQLRKNSVYGTLPVSLTDLSKDAQSIYQAALALRQRHESPLIEYWYRGMDDGEIHAWLRMREIGKSPLVVEGWHRGMEADEICARLRIREMERDLKRLSGEVARTVASDPGPERTAALKALYQELPARHLALSKERNALLEKNAQWVKKKCRDVKIKIAALFVSVLLWLWIMWEWS